MTSERKKKAFQFSAKSLSPKTASKQDVHDLQSLLARYGFLKVGYYPGSYDEATRHAVSQFQSFYKIYPEEDCVCDHDTINLLNQPRCGMSDPAPPDRTANGRLASYVTRGKWDKSALSYKFLNSTPDITEDRQREIIKEAFNRWENECGLKFSETDGGSSSDISISFHHGSHGDGNPFDDGGGSDGNTLAHAFLPLGGRWQGALHFDEFELWKDQPGGAGTRLYNVALHEIGHLLGLSHSRDTNAIMYAYYAEDRNDLRADDIAGIQSLYGSPVAAPIAISPGAPVSGHLKNKDDMAHYQVTVQNKLIVKLDGAAGQDFDLYLRHNEPVSLENEGYDEVSYGLTADELITLDAPKAGTYFILVHSYSGSGSYTLEAEIV